MRIRNLALAGAVLASARVAEGQSVGRMLEDDLKNVGKDAIAIWGAPFDASGRDWLLAGAALAVTGLSMFADQSVSDWAIENDSSAFFRALKPVRRGGTFFAGKSVVPPAAVLYVVGLALRNQDLRDAVMGCMTSWGAQSFARKAVANTIGRARPDTLPDDPQRWEMFAGRGNWQMRSFPAGHFANAVACATYWNHRFHLGAAEPLLYGVAAAIGVGRFADRAHWLSDSMIGGIFGYAVGKEIASRSLQRKAEREGGTTTFNVSPGANGLTLNLRWQF